MSKVSIWLLSFLSVSFHLDHIQWIWICVCYKKVGLLDTFLNKLCSSIFKVFFSQTCSLKYTKSCFVKNFTVFLLPNSKINFCLQVLHRVLVRRDEQWKWKVTMDIFSFSIKIYNHLDFVNACLKYKIWDTSWFTIP